MLQTELQIKGNHGLFQPIGFASLCKAVTNLASCQTAIHFTNENISKLMNLRFSDEVIHLEHPTQYHHWAVTVLENIRSLGLFFEKQFENLVRAKENTKWFFQPDGNTGWVGDSDRKTVSMYRKISSEVLFIHDNNLGKKTKNRLGRFTKSGFGFFRSNWEQKKYKKQVVLLLQAGLTPNFISKEIT